MGEKIPEASFPGTLNLAGFSIPCAVLEDGTRILSQSHFLTTIGRSRTPKAGTGATVAKVPTFLAANNLKPYIDSELRQSTEPIKYKLKGRTGFGYKAELLPKVCEVYLKARDDDNLLGNQNRIAERADLIMRALAHVGIIALVDEATGYQEIRDRLALQAILDKYLREEFAKKWAKRFPDEFYEEMFRLKQWQWKGMKVNRPHVVGIYTNDLVYDRLAPGVLAELKKRNPPDEKGVRKSKHHQWLTDDIGHPALQRHLAAVIALMKASANWRKFKGNVERALPKFGKTIPLLMEEEDD